jgi:hypothetical protein
MPNITHELIKCLSKVLDGTLIPCGSRIGKGPNVMFRVSFSTTIMSLMLTSNLENKTTVYSQAFASLHTFEVGTP